MESFLLSLANASRSEQCEIRYEDALRRTLILEQVRECDVKVKELNFSRECGGSVRTRHRGAQGFASCNALSHLPVMVKLADHQARLSSVAVDEGSIRPSSAFPSPGMVDLGSEEACLDETMTWLSDWHQQAFSADGRITAVQTSLQQKLGVLRFAAKDGRSLARTIAETNLQVVVEVREGTQTRMGIAMAGTGGPWQALRHESQVLQAACRRAVAGLTAGAVQPGRYTIIMDPVLAGVFIHEAFGHLSEADNRLANPALAASFAPGARLAPAFVTIYDVGDLNHCMAAYPFDDEGVPPERADLIVNGRVASMMHSLESALKLHECPTGNGRALSYRHRPIPRMRCTCLDPGRDSFEQLIADIPQGLYVSGCLGGQTNGSRFTFRSAETQLIERGRLTRPLRPVTLHGDAFSTLNQIERLGNRAELAQGQGGCAKQGQYPLQVASRAPHVRVRDVLVSG